MYYSLFTLSLFCFLFLVLIKSFLLLLYFKPLERLNSIIKHNSTSKKNHEKNHKNQVCEFEALSRYVVRIASFTVQQKSSFKESTKQKNLTAMEYAQGLWNQEKEIYKDLEHIGDGSELSQNILHCYMSLFDFRHLSLEQAFRDLCLKLDLKGETQQIDRVLCEFSDRYFKCNIQCIFGTTDIVHSIVYSLLLLNTDLHVAQGNYKKMSRTEFVNNTMNAIHAQLDPEEEPLSVYSSSTSTLTLSYHPSTESLANRTIGSKCWDTDIRNLLKQMYDNIRNYQIAHGFPVVVDRRLSFKLSLGVMKIQGKNSQTTISSSQTMSSNRTDFFPCIASGLYCTDLPLSITSQSPYYKEGLVSRKHLLERTNQKARHRDWKECFMVIDHHQLRTYKLLRAKHLSHQAIGKGDWMSQAQRMDEIDLKHSLASCLLVHKRRYVFSLQQATGATYLFEVGSEEQAQEWVASCNYWAARKSKQPSMGVSSMEYGWSGQCPKTIDVWQAPTPSNVTSELDELGQQKAVLAHVKELNSELEMHRELRSQLCFKNQKMEQEALKNWNKKSEYLVLEIIKYQNYCDCLEKSIDVQKKFMDS